MDKSKVFINLSKCTEEEQKHIFSLLPDDELRTYLRCNKFQPYLNFDFLQWFICNHEVISRKTELTYPEFIKLFEGGEGEKNVNYYDSVNRFIQSILDSDWLLDSEQQTKLTDLYINHRISEEF